MARKEIGSIFDRNNRNAMNDNFEYLFEGSKRINVLSDKADSVLNEAKKTNDMNKNVQQQINTLIAENGTSDAEVLQARIDAEGNEYPVLKDRLDESDAQLADIGQQKADKTYVDTKLSDISVLQINKNKGLIDQTFLSDELKQQMAGTTPINAVPGKGSLTKDRFSKNAISQEQTSFLLKGKNLYNRDDVFLGYALSTSTGDLFSSASYLATDFIGVKASTTYYRNRPSNVVFYDAAFTRISGITENSGSFTTPANCVYIRLSMGVGYRGTMQVEEGTQATEIENFHLHFESLRLKEGNFQKGIVPVNSLKDIVLGKNLFNKNDVTAGSVSMSTGIVDSGLPGVISSFIDIEPSTNYSKNIATNFAFYDANKVFIAGQFDSTMKTFTSPSNAKYIRISTVKKSNLGKLQLEKGSVVTPYEPYGYRINGLLYQSDIEKLKKSQKYPVPSKVEGFTHLPGGFTHVFGDIDKDGNIWAVAWENRIRKSTNGIGFKDVLDAKSFLNTGETISLYAFMVTDTGRIVCGTNQGRVLVSDEEQTKLTEAFRFENGFTQNSWGYDKKGRYILMATYSLTKNATSQGRELYLSKDFGATWKRIFYKPIEDMIDHTNYHIHDVAYDQYSDCILVSIGDEANRQIHYSYDYGETWNNMFDESVYNASNMAPIHPTSIVVFPDGYAFGSDELPEGISWWNRPKGVSKPQIKWEDCEYKVTFNEDKTLIGTFAQKGDMLHTESGIYGIMPFRNHNTTTEGHARLFVTGDGGKTWHEIFKDAVWTPSQKGFFNARMRKEGDGIYIYSAYSKEGNVFLWRAKLPNFIEN
ncbi:hypothetical protein [Nosocomiicoccus massiliensis]|uniref:hypothetical protein n=1 Tax=Nosocomiicoccus massiliensis TaxID=1232430 RepID=UPI0003F63F31|nr:hypothetical protein [Nosocomiicoccus massiliensis]